MSAMRKIFIIGGSVLTVILFTWLLVFLGNKFFPREDVPTIREASIIAENWVRNFSSTYPYYGRDLYLLEKKELERGVYEFVFSFVTDTPEYGVRENEIRVKTENTEVVEAVTNNIYDEIEKAYLEKEETVKIYFMIEREEEDELTAVERIVSASFMEKVEELALSELLKGPTEEEEREGYFTHIDRDTRVLSFNIREGVAYIELNVDIEKTEEGEIQLRETLTQFAEIRDVSFPKAAPRVVLEIEGVPEDFRFREELQEGSESEEVRYLQIVLNADPDTRVAETGPGSPGEETTRFGPSTTKAVMAFQAKYADEILEPAGLILSTGIVDSHTRDKLNSVLEESRW